MTMLTSAGHCYFQHLPEGDVVLCDPTMAISHVFTPSQLLLFAAFDHELHSKQFDPATGLAPGRYESFQALWFNDAECVYQFVFYDSADGTQLVAGEPIPINLIIPDGIDASHIQSKYSVREEHIMHGAMFLLLEKQQHQDEFISRKKAERLAVKKKKVLTRMKDIAAGHAGGRGYPGGHGGGSAKGRTTTPAVPTTATPAASDILIVLAHPAAPPMAPPATPTPESTAAAMVVDGDDVAVMAEDPIVKKACIEELKRKFNARPIGANASVAAAGPSNSTEAGPSDCSSGKAVAASSTDKDIDMVGELVDL
ncbi:hypothetical protein A0H81_01197 [Grifola frondosa]|uniref:Uncharacterized protein n=1 Tax=Grifola frondosa TaxID=5627 RepID=A0A1C7MS08_GRIFR|nr:hypothetical protein A0H81_01197 [Grifola frondosa]